MSVLKQIENSLKKKNPGEILFIKDFYKVGDYEAVRKSLQRLAEKGALIRLSQGIYYYPKKDELLGLVFPSAEQIGNAIAKRDKARIIPTGSYAIYRLGLTTQVPMNVVYLTDGSARKLEIGKQKIVFKKTSPKNLSPKNQLSSLIIQGLRAIGKENISQTHITKIKNIIVDSFGIVDIRTDMLHAPVWIQKIVFKILKEIENENLA
ncbi:MAG: DUF6088 family protein [Bacteroidales bacterium]|jgi:hypothetical protein|nr:DUF6088 family protein [Bacteroidales bacterium]